MKSSRRPISFRAAKQSEGLALEASLFGLCAGTEDKNEGTHVVGLRELPVGQDQFVYGWASWRRPDLRGCRRFRRLHLNQLCDHFSKASVALRRAKTPEVVMATVDDHAGQVRCLYGEELDLGSQALWRVER
jgi:hypothetical protein